VKNTESKYENKPKEKPLQFDIYKGKEIGNGQISKIMSVGLAILSPGSKTYKVFLNILLKDIFFLKPSKSGTSCEYVLMTRLQFQNYDNVRAWMRVGKGRLVSTENGGVVQLLWDVLVTQDIYMSLSPYLPGQPGPYSQPTLCGVEVLPANEKSQRAA